MRKPGPAVVSAQVRRRSFLPPVNELVRYLVVGLSLNLLGYLVYLLVTFLGASPLATVSIFYPLSVIAGYFAHRRHTFQHQARGLQGKTLVRYVLVYVVGYFINAGLLGMFYHKLGYPHQLVQIVAIFVVAVFLFIAMKVFVFTSSPSPDSPS